MCHGEKKYRIQGGIDHTRAYRTLEGEQAKQLAAEHSIEDPTKDGRCLKCHVTAYGAEASLSKEIKLMDGVDCEACHGPGDLYCKIIPHRFDDQEAIRQGFIPLKPEQAIKELCEKCHNAMSPTAKTLPPAAWKERAHK